MRTIDLILGEKNPTYANSENIAEDDFFYLSISCDYIA
jgi:hypothetical protein